MANFTYNDAVGNAPIAIDQVFAEKQGGGLVRSLSVTIPEGTAVGLSDDNVFRVIKAYRLTAEAGSSDTTIKIAKGSGVAVGDVIATGKKGVACTAVDTSNAAYDVVTVSLGTALTAGTVLYQAAAASASAAAPIYTPLFVTGAEVPANSGDVPTRLVNGANLRKATANVAAEVVALMKSVELV